MIKSKTVNDNKRKESMNAKVGKHNFYIEAPKYAEEGWEDNLSISELTNLVNKFQELYVYTRKSGILLFYSVTER